MMHSTSVKYVSSHSHKSIPDLHYSNSHDYYAITFVDSHSALFETVLVNARYLVPS